VDVVVLAGPDGWSSGPVWVAAGFARRWRGLRGREEGAALLLSGCSVHGVGMRRPLWTVGLDVAGLVVGVRRLDPGRLVWMRGAAWVLELPIERLPPAVGATVGPLP
jgi:hypothetical protein